MKKLRYTLCSFSLCAVILTVAASGTLVSAADDRQEPIVSPSLAVISEDNSMAMAGIISKIPPDEVIDAMKSVGDKMDVSLRETAGGGLAQTPAGIEASKKLLSDN